VSSVTSPKNPAGRKFVTVKFRDGRMKTVPANLVDWHHDPKNSGNDVITWGMA